MRKYLLIGVLDIVFLAGMHAQSLKDTLKIDEVVVTGSRIEVNRKNMPVNVSVLTKSDINEVEESAVLPVLGRKIPGMFITERGVTGFGVGVSSAGQISMRGVGGNPNTQVLMLVDGQPQFMGIFGHPLPNSYVASDLERVEIIKGPGSIIYGSNAMGGVINFITKRQDKDGFSGNARIAYGSYNTQKYMINGGLRKKGFQVFASINRDVTDGHRDSSEFEINNAYVKASYTFNKYFKVTADYNIADFNSVDPGRDIDVVPAFRADILRGKTSFTVTNKFNKTEGGIYSFYNFGEHVLSDGWISNDENYGISAYQGIKLPGNTLLTTGLDYKKYGGRGNGGMRANIWNTINEKGAYVVLRHEIKQVLNISYGMRIENNSEYGNELVPQAGLSWSASENTRLKASVSKGFRSPTILEMYLFAPNPELRPERMMNYEIDIGHDMLNGKLKTGLSLFIIEGSNIILVMPNDNPPPPVKRVNTGTFSNKGFEAEGNYFYNESLSFEFSYAFLKTKEPMLAAPAHQLYVGFNYKWDKLVLSVQNQYIGKLYTETGITENYDLLNASVKYHLFSFGDLFISGKNLLDQRYEINYGYPMPGLHFMTGVNIKF